MLGDILKAITRPGSDQNIFIDSIASDTRQINSELAQLQSQIESLPMSDIKSCLSSSNQPKSPTFLSQNWSQTIQTLESFYAMCRQEQAQNRRCQNLIEECHQIAAFFGEYDVFGTLALKDTVPVQSSINYLRELKKSLGEELLQWQNKQNVNRFQAENHATVIQEYSNIIKVIKTFIVVSEQIYASVIETSYTVKTPNCSVKKQYLQVIWEEMYFGQKFVKQIEQCLRGFVQYDVNSRQYTLLVYKQEENQAEIKIQQKSKIIFENSQVSLHYDSIIDSVSHLKHFLNTLSSLAPPTAQSLLNQLQDKLFSHLHQYFQPMLPYLPMQKRKPFLYAFNFGPKNLKNQNNFCQLLLNLKVGRQDADIMMNTLDKIVQRILKNKGERRMFEDFIQIAKRNRKYYNVVMFVCDQVIEGLQKQKQIGGEIVKMIRELLKIREQMRMKIHHGQ